MNRYLTALCVVSFLFAVAASGLATPYPTYTCTELIGLSNGSHGENSYAGTLLPNGTVIGQTVTQSGIAPTSTDLYNWNSSGNGTAVYTVNGLAGNVWGDQSGRYIVWDGTDYVWNGSTYTGISSAEIPTASQQATYGASDAGLIFGGNNNSTLSWAYDLNTSTYYSFATGTGSYASGASATGYVVGTNNGAGYVWQESSRSLTPISGLEVADGISDGGQYIAGENTSGKAALYSLSGSQLGTYWSGEATFVNDNGLAVGDTTAADNSGNYGGRAMAYFPSFNGGTSVDLSTAYAPSGVTFDFAAGVNDAGQILVAANYGLNCSGYNQMYLLTPTPEPSALLLMGTGLLGLIAYAWRKRR